MASKKVPSPTDLLGGREAERPPAKRKKTKHKSTHVDHHPDGSHTVRHVPHDGSSEVSYAVDNLDKVHDGLEEHVGEPNYNEEGEQ